MSKRYSLSELLVIASAREIHDGDKVLIGTGFPMIAGAVAKKLHAPNAILMMESGIIDFDPLIPLANICDASACKGFSYSTDLYSTFTDIANRGFIDLCFLGAGQVDKFGNVNTTTIGDYYNFDVRISGPGGAPEFMGYSKKTILTLNKGEFVEKLDYITSPGYLDGGNSRDNSGLFPLETGPYKLISKKGIFRFDQISKEIYLDQLFPGFKEDDIKKDFQWNLKISQDLSIIQRPTDKELEVLRKFNAMRSISSTKVNQMYFSKFINDLPEKGKKYFMEVYK